MVSREQAQEIHDLMLKFDKALGVIGEGHREKRLPKDAEELVARREEARKAKDWKTADQMREQLKTMGIVIEDTAQGVRWRTEKH